MKPLITIVAPGSVPSDRPYRSPKPCRTLITAPMLSELAPMGNVRPEPKACRPLTRRSWKLSWPFSMVNRCEANGFRSVGGGETPGLGA